MFSFTRISGSAPSHYSRPQQATTGILGTHNLSATLTGRAGELSLDEQISEGRIGLTYIADVISAHAENIPKQVCIKFAKKEHCRSIAREAWFYEQLSDLQGISIPRCYGFFTSTASQQDIRPEDLDASRGFHPWYYALPDDELTGGVDYGDWLPDDAVLGLSDSEACDSGGHRDGSPWNEWTMDEDDPTIAVLILELLGDQWADYWCYGPVEGADANAEFDDVFEVMEDLVPHGVLHFGRCARNILRCDSNHAALPLDPRQYCKRHGKHHGWRVIDFDRAARMDTHNMSETPPGIVDYGLPIHYEFQQYMPE